MECADEASHTLTSALLLCLVFSSVPLALWRTPQVREGRAYCRCSVACFLLRVPVCRHARGRVCEPRSWWRDALSNEMAAKIKLTSNVGRMVDCSQADDRKMIRLVKERPLLFARNNMPVASFYAQVKRLWEEVAREMNWTGKLFFIISNKFVWILKGTFYSLQLQYPR